MAIPVASAEDLAQACVGYVRQKLGLSLDFEPETLPLLDHYLAEVREDTIGAIEARELVAAAAGAYVGELLRRRHACWWAMGGNTTTWQLQFAVGYLVVSPMAWIHDALIRPAPGTRRGAAEEFGLSVSDEDRAELAARLSALPPVREDEYFALATRVEVVDIVLDHLEGKREACEAELLTAADYDDAEPVAEA